ncbi:hypothetical protein V2J09_014554 [Rumex salicifolius]
MGAGLSGLVEPEGDGVSPAGMALGDLPECCVALIVARLEPPEICHLAMLNRAFRGASTADFVWQTKLPSNYIFLVRKLLGEMPERMRMREIYARLCSPIRFDGGTKELWLEKTSGKMCMIISWKGMKITGIDDRRYWSHISSEESRFHTIAYLQQVWWLEVGGALEFQFPEGSYSVFFKLHIGKISRGRGGRRACNLGHVHGWDIKPVRFQLSTSNGQQTTSQCYLGEAGNWVYHHVGDFAVESSDLVTKVKFSMTQIDCTHTKAGLCLDSVFIYPSEFRDSLKGPGFEVIN